MLYSAEVNGGQSLNVVQSAYETYYEGFIMMSAFGYTNAVKDAARSIKKKSRIRMDYVVYDCAAKTLDVSVSHVPESEYSHIVIWKKDTIYSENGEDNLKLFIFVKKTDSGVWDNLRFITDTSQYPPSFVTAVYDKLYANCPFPILKEWVPFLIRYLISNNYMRQVSTKNSNGVDEIVCFVIDISIANFIDRLKFALEVGSLTIGNNGKTSEFMSSVEGIDAYLLEYSKVLTKKIQTNFRPVYVPQQDPISEDLAIMYDYIKCNDKISLYPAQTAVAQAVTNAFNNGKKCCFITADCGSGKTTIGIAAVNTHWGAFEKRNFQRMMTNVVMCPSHLVNLWQREIDRRSPMSQSVIVQDFSHLISLMPLIKNKKRRKHLWLIISKETAKFGYELRPAAVWREHKRIPTESLTAKPKGVFCCPVCGQRLFYSTKEGQGRHRRIIRHYLTETSFRKMSLTKNNIRCENTVRYWDKQQHMWKHRQCNAFLWGPATKDTLYDGQQEHEDRWLKLPRQGGWMQRRHLRRVYDRILEQDKPTSEELQFLTAISDELNDNGVPQRAPRKYPIATFIKKYLKGKIDYVCIDECHLLKSKDSLQGEALGDIISASKRCLALTGTLLNGFCSGIFYLLYRLFPQQMKKQGYEYNDVQDFSRDFGVYQKVQVVNMDQATIRRRNRQRSSTSTQTKELPGISPIVFTRFLLENVAFIALEDIAESLPSYEEIPLPLDMPDYLKDGYEQIKMAASQILGHNCKRSVATQIIQLLSVYPDQPYKQPPVYDPESETVLISPPELTDTERIKENALLSLCQEKIAEGEHILVYYAWTNRTDVKEKVPLYLESFGIKTAVLSSSVKAQEREEWLKEQVNNGVDVIFCNPSLVETGLSLLDFTTIVFYQMSYNLYTMRQASRRSWRINQDHDVQVYFLYYKDTVQEQALSIMATKLQAAMAIEGRFSEEGLNAMSDSEDILTQIATAVTEDIKGTVSIQTFQKHKASSDKTQTVSDIVEEDKEDTVPILLMSTDTEVNDQPVAQDINENTMSLLNSVIKKIEL